MAKLYALLVGIDLYLNNGAREGENGQILALNRLRGPTNDVRAIESFLRSEWQFEEITTLTSTFPSPVPEENVDVAPSEPPERLPTFFNIQAQFDRIRQASREGDLFFFHFSGHGERLDRVPATPRGRMKDPSLLTVDFCCGQPAVRGWQLNQWLRDFHTRGVQVVASLDSCCSGGAWRDGSGLFRTPKDWPSRIPNMTIDEEAAEAVPETDNEPIHRDATLEESWAINPREFTLMVACASTEKATETMVEQEVMGVFSRELLRYLGNRRSQVTYRGIRDQLVGQLRRHGQTPAIFGRDRLLFFGRSEPFSAPSVRVEIIEGHPYIMAGSAHGVHLHSEFCLSLPTGMTVLRVTREPELFKSRIELPEGVVGRNLPGSWIAYPSRWSLDNKTLLVVLDESFSVAFRDSLAASLRRRIASPVTVMEEEGTKTTKCVGVGMAARAKMWWQWVTGPTPALRRLEAQDNEPEKLATQVAAPLAQLARFGHIKDLQQTIASTDPAPFTLTFTAARSVDGPPQPPYPLSQDFVFNFRNTSPGDLFLTILDISPEFGIHQVFPPEDLPQLVESGRRCGPLRFTVEPPEATPLVAGGLRLTGRRDIIRTLVTKEKLVSWKSLELPHLWNADEEGLREAANPGDRLMRLQVEQCVWVDDREVITGPEAASL
ncbi:hypothetical protein BO78DRAFT_453553 [Aspergillus sclerotiicarbonarius CBS 121057]|uniref:Peptidase C14 caspase domain-containing protein n=1 Tax=Aspergillus sclerotiicarbonarius (strain CBS 121057 / IBT 28362) TaxID=1448318 RepID=A0A319E7P5_ASPSB|nr:hypothetical protein BO78DRAFT_453553 [Aspergillus sclerotiicarbonarius CBS 121057]